MKVDSTVVFEPTGTYTSIRIPALLLTKKGTLLAFAAGRTGNGSDWVEMDLIMKRSIDNGITWEPTKIIAHRQGEQPTDNPVPIVDHNGVVHLLYQRGYSRAYHIESKDDGITWSEPKDITSTFDAFKPEYDWKVIATGPGHSVQLKSGRLLVPIWLANSDVLTPKEVTSHLVSLRYIVTTMEKHGLGESLYLIFWILKIRVKRCLLNCLMAE